MNNAQLEEKILGLETAINDEQQEVANALAALETENQALRDQVAAGATPEQLQAHADRVDAIIADVKETIPGLPDPEPEEPGE